MSTIDGLGRPGPIRNRAQAGRGPGGGFRLLSDPARSATLEGCAAAASAAALGCMIAIQEGEPETVEDRQARRKGQELLQMLTDLQRAMLAGLEAGDSLQLLSSAITDLPRATDPRLAGIVQAIVLRTRVELARRGL